MNAAAARDGDVAPWPRTGLESLRAVRAILGPDGAAWLERNTHAAADGFDKPCGTFALQARRWGLSAAARLAGGTDQARTEAFDWLRCVVGPVWIPRWEEAPERTPAEVLAALDAAIALAAAGDRP